MLDIFTKMLKILTELMRYQLKGLRRSPKYEEIFGIFEIGRDVDQNLYTFGRILLAFDLNPKCSRILNILSQKIDISTENFEILTEMFNISTEIVKMLSKMIDI